MNIHIHIYINSCRLELLISIPGSFFCCLKFHHSSHLQVHPDMDVLKNLKLTLGRSITLPVIRNVEKLEKGTCLTMIATKRNKEQDVEPLRDPAAKRRRTKSS